MEHDKTRIYIAHLISKHNGIIKVLELFDIEIKDIRGNQVNWADFNGKLLLFVNVASACGFTPQYQQMQELYAEYGEKLEIIGLPCNDFGGQEPGSAEQIQSFCEINYGVTFTITEKVNIINDPHPIIQYLCKIGNTTVEIDWNFNKFFVNREGLVTHHFRSATSPIDEEILSLIT